MYKALLTVLFFLLLGITCMAQEIPKDEEVVHYSSILDTLQEIYDNPFNYISKDDPSTYAKHFDALFEVIEGTYLDTLEFSTLEDQLFSIDSLEKPLLLYVTASWCAPCKAQIPALNKIVEKYHDRLDFVALFWDNKTKLRELAPEYNPKMTLIPSVKGNKANEVVLGDFKHILGFPSRYGVLQNRKIVEVGIGGSTPMDFTTPDGQTISVSKEESEEINYSMLKEIVDILLEE